MLCDVFMIKILDKESVCFRLSDEITKHSNTANPQVLEPANIGLEFYVTFDLKFKKIVRYFPLIIDL